MSQPDDLDDVRLLHQQLHAAGAAGAGRDASLRLVNAGYARVLTLEAEIKRLSEEVERLLNAGVTDDVPALLRRRRALTAACQALRRALKPLSERALVNRHAGGAPPPHGSLPPAS